MVGREPGFDVAADDASRVGGSLIARNSSFDIGARAGYVVGGNALLYARGSYEICAPASPPAMPAAPCRAMTVSTAGAWAPGVERFVADKVSARIEYRYSDLSSGGKRPEADLFPLP
ncbi:outer membrane protein [Sphingobium scionense]|uniref:Uncharacterized protein n=1 Tax=Sphingobium scionense TaxID=1404341 RepID=A0A7W6LR23_9SPHN|nr:hypothetical protein [Sphingobium scionense]MBB4148940.1 hypothetical protein [Sphingobium scionense]